MASLSSIDDDVCDAASAGDLDCARMGIAVFEPLPPQPQTATQVPTTQLAQPSRSPASTPLALHLL
jgi:hypothetical protein